jgi:hypothetical protein
MEKSIYEIQKEAVIINHDSLLLITDPSLELIELAYRSYMSKIIGGLPLKLSSRMLILFANYESNILKQKMLNKRKLEELD